MLVLGLNAKDKGTQLEALIHAVLMGEGFANVRSNVVAAGGNELDVIATTSTPVLGQATQTQLVCEAKAYADTVNMPTWQRFLGKLFLHRLDDLSTIGILIALNGVNGHVAGSFRTLSRIDKNVLIIEGSDLVERAQRTAELADTVNVLRAAEAVFERRPRNVEPAYYASSWLWIVRWSDDEYSTMEGSGNPSSAERVAELRAVLEASLTGTLLAPDDVTAQAEARHDERLRILGRLFAGDAVELNSSDITEELSNAPFCEITAESATLVPADSLDSAAVLALFDTLFQGRLRVRHLRFVADGLHIPYVQRLIDVLPDVQSGLMLPNDDLETLRRIAPLFPSIWVNLINPIPFLVPHAGASSDENLKAVDRNAFWETMQACMRADFADAVMRGFLFDHLGVAELEEHRRILVKAKTQAVGATETSVRDMIGVIDMGPEASPAARHVLIRALPSAPEPWDTQHPDPVIELADS